MASLDQSLAYTALHELYPPFWELGTAAATALAAELEAAWAEAQPENKWDFTREWVAARQASQAPAGPVDADLMLADARNALRDWENAAPGTLAKSDAADRLASAFSALDNDLRTGCPLPAPWTRK